MKKLLQLFLVVVFTLVVSLAYAEEMEMHSTEHFVYAVPKGWHKEETDGSVLHFEDLSNLEQCSYIGVTEQIPGSGISSGMDGADIFFDALISMACGDQGADSKIEKFQIDGYPAAIVQSNAGGETAVYTFLFAEEYMYTQLLTDVGESSEGLFETAKSLAGSLHYIDGSANILENADAFPDPKDYSGSVLRKTYQPYDYDAAKNTPNAYSDTSVFASGMIFNYKIFDDGWGYALIFEGEGSNVVYITLPPGSIADGIEIGDNIEVYGVSQGLTETTPPYPIILTTMQLLNYGG